MTTNKLAVYSADPKPSSASSEDIFSNPLHISDIISVCRNYSKLGYQMQSQIDAIMEVGVTEAVDCGLVSIAALPLIKDYFIGVAENLYFGEACDQASDYVVLIELFEQDNAPLFITAN